MLEGARRPDRPGTTARSARRTPQVRPRRASGPRPSRPGADGRTWSLGGPAHRRARRPARGGRRPAAGGPTQGRHPGLARGARRAGSSRWGRASGWPRPAQRRADVGGSPSVTGQRASTSAPSLAAMARDGDRDRGSWCRADRDRDHRWAPVRCSGRGTTRRPTEVGAPDRTEIRTATGASGVGRGLGRFVGLAPCARRSGAGSARPGHRSRPASACR